MSSEFNAYSSWLGIPEDEQPPHYYRLLGLEPFEADPDAIRQAGQRVLSLVKSREKGSLGSAARRLKAEVTFAAACLLDEKKKTQYDRELDAWFNDYDSGSHAGDDYELEEPDLPMAKIVQRSGEKAATRSKSGSGKTKSGSSVRSGASSKSGSGKSKSKSTKVEAKTTAKRPLNVGLIAGLAVAVVAVLGLGGALAYVFLKSDEPPVAQAPAKVEPEFDPDDEDAVASKTAATDPLGEKDPDASDVKPAVAADADKTADGTDVQPLPELGAAEAAKADPAAPGATSEAPAENPMPAATVATPMPMPMATPMPTPEAEKKEDPKTAAPPATEVAKVEATPDPKLEDPFRELDTALELPVFVDATSTAPVVLAKIYPKEGEPVNAKLLAGEAVLAKMGEFELSGGIQTGPEPKWTIKFVDKQEASTPVADLSFKNNELSFAWTGQGDPEKNNVLRNCLLKVSAGYTNRNLPLRKPVEIEPLSVVMEPKGSELSIPFVGLPEDRETVIMEITKLVGGFPADATYDPGQQIKLGETVSIMFGKSDLAFKGNFSEDRGTGLSFEVKPMIRGPKPRNNGPRPLKGFVIKPSLDQQIANATSILNQGTTNYELFKKNNAANKAALETADLQFQQATTNINEQIKRLNEMKTAIETIAKEGKVQFRIFMRVGDYSVELVKTKDYSPPEPDKKEAEKKK